MASTEKTLRDARSLAEAGLVAPERLPALEAVAARYAVAITPAMAELIEPADADDPIARQFVPRVRGADLHARRGSGPNRR